MGRFIAGASIPRRLILLDREVLDRRGEFERILVHEIFHFAWRRMSNDSRRDWEQALAREFAHGASGELGWSAETRKRRLTRDDWRARSSKWRRYACESFCDTAAWMYAHLAFHEEFTLPARFRRPRKRWFERTFPATRRIPI